MSINNCSNDAVRQSHDGPDDRGLPFADDPLDPRPAPTTLDCTSVPASWADDGAGDADGGDAVGGGSAAVLPSDGSSFDGVPVTAGHDLAVSLQQPAVVVAVAVVLPVVGVPMERLAEQ